MNFKIDTKGIFNEIEVNETLITANMAADITALNNISSVQQPHLIIRLNNVAQIDDTAAQALYNLQQHFYNEHKSLVISEMQAAVEKTFEQLDLLDEMNTAPTLSEAKDIVNMEEVERELSGDADDVDTNFQN